jgi:hypothetical protein
LDDELGQFFHERNVRVLQCYGMTELGGWVMLSGLSAGEFGFLRAPQEYIPYMMFERRFGLRSSSLSLIAHSEVLLLSLF